MAASTLFVHAAPPKEGFVSASFNSHCVAFLSLHINVLFIMVWFDKMQYTSIQLHTSPTELSDYFSKQTFIFNWDINNNAFLT